MARNLEVRFIGGSKGDPQRAGERATRSDQKSTVVQPPAERVAWITTAP